MSEGILGAVLLRLKDDSYVEQTALGGIHARHFMSIDNPIFPMITIVRRSGGGGDPVIDAIDEARVEVSIWGDGKGNSTARKLEDLYYNLSGSLARGVRAALHNKSFEYSGILVQMCTEIEHSGVLYEPEEGRTGLYRVASIYWIKAILHQTYT